MAFQPVGNAAEVVIKGEYQGEASVMTFGFLGGVGYGFTELKDLVDTARDSWIARCLPTIPSAYQAFEAVGKGLRSQFDVEYTASFGAAAFGGIGGPPLPNNVSLAIARKTGLTGRSRRGRVFWPGFVEADVSANQVSSLRTSDIVDALQLFMVDVNDLGTFALSVISRQVNGVILPVGVAHPVVTWTVTDRTVDSMRRRLPGRGH